VDVVELRAGPDQVLVVYRPMDTGSEIDPLEVFSAVAADAEGRAAKGEWIVSMAALPLRHAGTALGQEGSGYETKTAVAVVYGRIGNPGGPASA
jgi:hypothetical protein